MTMVGSRNISVSFIGDLPYARSDDNIFVESNAAYVNACKDLTFINESSSELKVLVRKQNHFAWLKDFVKQIRCNAKFSELTPRLLLAEKWNVALPERLKNAEILDQQLLNLEIENNEETTSLGNRLLVHFVGSDFQQDVIHPSNLVDVVIQLTNADARTAFEKYPVLQSSLNAKCKKWAENASKAWLKEVCLKLTENIEEIWHWLSLWSCLHAYPRRLLEYVLTPEQVLFIQNVPAEVVCTLPLESKALKQSVTQIEQLLKQIEVQLDSNNEFQKVLGWMSGKLLVEYEFISNILRFGQFSPTKVDVQKTQIKFKNCPGVSETSLNLLRYCVEPSRPTMLSSHNEKWNSTGWVRWTVDEYIPYRTWQIHNNQYDEQLEKTVIRFSDWYIKEFASLQKDPDLSLIHCLNGITSSDIEPQLLVILLVDCLPLEFIEILNDALSSAGFKQMDLHYRFAALPTVTEYNKPFLISGRWEPNSRTYDTILSTRAKSDWNKIKTIYVGNLRDFSEVPDPEESAVILLNFINGDALLHSDVESQNSSYDEELRRYYLRMADSLEKLSKRWSGPKDSVSVYVVTDHGACRILEEEKKSFNSSVVNKLFADQKYRYADVDEEREKDFSDNIWTLGYRFKQPYLSIKNEFFLPKGHNTVKQPNSAKGYMHGGVTPEEVIVPIALYKLVDVDWETPIMRFLNKRLMNEAGIINFYIQRIVSIQFEVQNPNVVDLQITGCSVLSPETEIKKDNFFGIVPANCSESFDMDCYFSKEAKNHQSLEIQISYEIENEQHTSSLSLSSRFRSAMSGGLNLKDL